MSWLDKCVAILTQEWAAMICIIIGVITMFEGCLYIRVDKDSKISDILECLGLFIIMLPFIAGLFK